MGPGGKLALPNKKKHNQNRRTWQKVTIEQTNKIRKIHTGQTYKPSSFFEVA